MPPGKEVHSPESLLDRAVLRLKRQTLWDWLLLLLPPLLGVSYLVLFVSFSDPISYRALLLAGIVLLGVALVIGRLWRQDPGLASKRAIARTIDNRVQGQDRFITLATLDPTGRPSSLLERVRQEAATLQARVDLRRDFPYRVKRSFLISSVASVAILLLFHLFLQMALLTQPQAAPVQELALLAKKLSQIPGLSEMARSLEGLALRMQEKNHAPEELRAVIEKLLHQVDKQLAAEKQKGGEGNDLLNQVGDTLRKLEQGLEGEQGERGAGELRTNLPEQRGEGKESKEKGGGGEGRGEVAVLATKDPPGGRPAGKDEEGKGDGQGNQGAPDRVEKDTERGKEQEGDAKEEKQTKGSKSQDESIPRGAPPQRFLEPGEGGEKELKGARFVIVQLPEAAADRVSGDGGSGQRKKLQPKVPVTNVPLPRSTGSPTSPEKQPVPLEYRNLIR